MSERGDPVSGGEEKEPIRPTMPKTYKFQHHQQPLADCECKLMLLPIRNRWASLSHPSRHLDYPDILVDLSE
ncbi:hypothetical protein KQX54_019798 [Cotesia glomerata]|uniref:Uncharacterized protein n=1 Tax=Cotesia glomerata TaxID=32391 RepID=A0AAV7HGF4_COTGL|nr:hypothetical protein KQX54_019798 [Cotesia glomerata]